MVAATPGTAVVTGASSGIGEALARELRRRGWRVGLLARRAERLEALAGELGDGCAWAVADVTDAAAVARAVAELEERLGPVDLVVANAGVGGFLSARRFDASVAATIMRTNYEGVLNAVAAVLPGMVARGRGHLAVVSSLAAWRGLPGSMGYGASKAAISHFMEGFRPQVARLGIAVTTIHPGFVKTALTDRNTVPMPFLMGAEAAARRIADGLERRRPEVNLPWPMVLIMHLVRLAPRFLYEAVARRMAGGRAPRPPAAAVDQSRR